VERSEPFDAWDDAGDDPRDDPRNDARDPRDPRDDQPNGSIYGPAPLPAHERTWRHPSEVGHATWVLTEPPVAIGRGLLVTTGAIGCVLGIAVLWLLVPIGGGLAPTAAPTVTSSFSASRPGVATLTSDASLRTDLVTDSTVALTLTQSSITLPSEDVPLNTVLVTRPATPDNNAVAVAVSVGDVPYIVTTAHAVDDQAGFSIIGTGDPADGSIVAIDGNLAFLQSAAAMDVVAFTETGSAQVGDTVTVLGQEQTPVQFVGAGAVVGLDVALVREGTPVIDESGALVALCTLVQDAGGSYVALVPIGGPPTEPTTDPGTTVPDTGVADTSTTSTTPGPSSGTTPVSTPDTTSTTTAVTVPVAWAGIRFVGVDGAATPLIASVFTDSPAALAGLQSGDQIVAVDAVAVTRQDEVLAAIKAKAPGDTIVFTVVANTAVTQPAPSTSNSVPPAQRTISVVLGVYEPGV
jgi:hypothetical protein